MLALRLLAAAFATYRISTLLAYDDGPFDVFKRLRAGAGRRASTGQRFYWGLANLLNCPYCSGVWLAVLHGIFSFYPSQLTDMWLFVWAIAGLQAVLLDLSKPER